MTSSICDAKATELDAEQYCKNLCDILLMIDESERASIIAKGGMMFVEFCGNEISRLGSIGSATGFFMAANQI